MTNVWTSLLLTLTGGVLAIAGTATSLRIQAKHANLARQEEYKSEDTYRLFEKRQLAYSELYLRLGPVRRCLSALYQNSDSEEAAKAASEARSQYWSAYTVVRLIGSPEVYNAANDLLRWIDQSMDVKQFDSSSYRSLLNRFTRAARAELVNPVSSRPEAESDAVPVRRRWFRSCGG